MPLPKEIVKPALHPFMMLKYSRSFIGHCVIVYGTVYGMGTSVTAEQENHGTQMHP